MGEILNLALTLFKVQIFASIILVDFNLVVYFAIAKLLNFYNMANVLALLEYEMSDAINMLTRLDSIRFSITELHAFHYGLLHLLACF